MASTDIVSILLRLEQVRQFVSGADQASKSVGKIGTEAEQTGKKSGVAWKGIAKWAGGVAIFYGVERAIHGALDATESLGKSSVALSRTTGMDVSTSSQWVAVAQARGIQTKQLQTAFVKLSKQSQLSQAATTKETAAMRDLNAQAKAVAEQGGKKAPAALAALQKKMLAAHEAGDKARKTLAQLGVSQQVIASGNTAEEMNQIADGLSRLHNAQKRAAIMQTLFGRGGQALLPILMKGRKGLQDQLAVVRKYGDYLGVKTVGDLKKMQAEQREQTIATQGMKIQFGQALLPVMMQVEHIILQITKALAPLTKNATAMKVVIFGLAAAFLAYKIAMIAATIATGVFETAAAPVVGITLGVVAAVALLAIGIVLLWKHCKWFRDAVKEAWAMAKTAFAGILQAAQVVFNWVKQNWPLLVGALFGPFGVAAALVITHWGQVKSFLLGVFDAVKSKATTVANGIAGVFQTVVGAIKAALNTLINGWNALHFKLPGFKV